MRGFSQTWGRSRRYCAAAEDPSRLVPSPPERATSLFLALARHLRGYCMQGFPKNAVCTSLRGFVAHCARLAAAALLFPLGACATNQLGPCEVVFEEPLLTVSRVSAAGSGAMLSPVLIRSISFNGAPIASLDAVLVGGPSPNITPVGSDLRCTVSCGFATREGRYQFTVTYPGYRDTTLTVPARYSRKTGGSNGCPTRIAGGVAITLILATG